MKTKQDKIDKGLFERLCMIQCSRTEVSSVLEISDDTLDRWCTATYGKTFAETFKNFAGKGKASVRRMLFAHAEKNASACIFLAKNLLGYSDNPNATAAEADLSLMESLLDVVRKRTAAAEDRRKRADGAKVQPEAGRDAGAPV